MKNIKLKKFNIKKVSPYLVMILSFFGVIILGSILLYLPISTYEGHHISYIDAIFTSASATCVTGLSTIPNVGETFTLFGKIIIGLLIEIGGISIVTLTSFFIILLGKKIGISSRFFLASTLNTNTNKGIVSLVKRIVIISFSIQLVFLVFNYFILSKYYDGFLSTLGYAAFHTASSFNNAGFDIFGSTSMIQFSGDILLNISTMLMIVLGGLGFVVLYELFRLPFDKKLSLHSKIVLTMTLGLILIPAIIFRFTMNVNWLESFFASITARTAGFTTIDLNSVMKETPAYPLMLILMFIGASPGSTGGGIKTTTFFVIATTITHSIVGKKPKAYKRSIATDSIMKSLTLIAISIAYIVILIILLKVFEPNMSYHDLIFESFSAFGTVGLSMGITSSLSIGSKILICITMFIGRLGPLTFISFWNNSFMKETSSNVRYVEEKMIIG